MWDRTQENPFLIIRNGIIGNYLMLIQIVYIISHHQQLLKAQHQNQNRNQSENGRWISQNLCSPNGFFGVHIAFMGNSPNGSLRFVWNRIHSSFVLEFIHIFSTLSDGMVFKIAKEKVSNKQTKTESIGLESLNGDVFRS